MKLEWYEHEEFQWICTNEDDRVVAQIKHYPTGWRITWRFTTKHPWQEKIWPDTELEEAKAWAIAMIRMSQ